MNKETLRMQMLAGIITETQYKQKLKELYINSNGELMDKSNLIAAQLDNMFEVELIDSDKFPNLDSYIKFEASFKKFPNRKTLTDIISNQILQCYKGTALESFNKKVGFSPTLKTQKGGGFDIPVGAISLVEGKINMNRKDSKDNFWIYPPLWMEWAVSPKNYTLGDLRNLAKSLSKDISPSSEDDEESTKIGDETYLSDKTKLIDNPEELEDLLKFATITFIPFISTPKYDEIDISPPTNLTTSTLKNYFNDVGLDYINLLNK
jgi:hypothetical protein